MDEEAHRDWVMTLDAQNGVADRSQLEQAGFTRQAVAHRLKSGKWQRMQRGVYATFTGPAQREAKLWAAVRRAGPGAMLSHETAAEVHGLTGKEAAKIHVTVPTSRRPGQHKPIPGVVIHRSDQSRPQRLPEGQLPRTSIEDTVLDLVAAAKTFADAYGWISRALSERRVTADVLRGTLTARSRVRWRVLVSEALAESDDGTLLPLERRYAREVERAHGLPKAERQAHRAGYRDYRICVEFEGVSSQLPEQVRLDAQTYRFTLVDVTERACESAATVAAALRRHGWQGQPHPCRRPDCPISHQP